MRISDWSSDVCSSDLPEVGHLEGVAEKVAGADGGGEKAAAPVDRRVGMLEVGRVEDGDAEELHPGIVIDDVMGLLVVDDLVGLELPQRRAGRVVARSEARRVGKGCVRTW